MWALVLCRTSLSINRLGRTDSKINFQLPASITCPCQKPVAWGQAVKFSSELVDHKFVNSTNLLDDLFLEAQCYSFWARNSTDLIAPHEYEVLGKMIQNFGAVDALNTDAVAPPPSFAAAPAPYQAAPGSPSSAAPTAPAINILVRGCNLVFKHKVSSNRPSTVLCVGLHTTTATNCELPCARARVHYDILLRLFSIESHHVTRHWTCIHGNIVC